MEKAAQEIDKEVYIQLGKIPDNLEQRITTYRKNLDKFFSTLKQNWEVQADTEDNLAANISIAQEEYDADSDSTEVNSADWNAYWMPSDSEGEEEQDFQYESDKEPPNINYIREGARNLHITIPEEYHAYEN